VVVTGASKVQAVSRAFGPEAEPTEEVPGSLLAGHVGRLTVLLDPDAAAGL